MLLKLTLFSDVFNYLLLYMPLFVRCLSIRGCPSTTTEEKKRKKKKKRKKEINKFPPNVKRRGKESNSRESYMHWRTKYKQTPWGLFIINVVTLDRYWGKAKSKWPQVCKSPTFASKHPTPKPLPCMFNVFTVFSHFFELK